MTVALTLTNFALSAAGYKQPESTCGETPSSTTDLLPDTQPQKVLDIMRFLIGPLPALFFVMAILLVYMFPITKETHKKQQQEVMQSRHRRTLIFEAGITDPDEIAKMMMGSSSIVDVQEPAGGALTKI